MPSDPAISVIVPLYNASAFIETCLAGLKAQDITQPVEFILIDDASTDDTLAKAQAFPLPDVQIEQLEVNKGPAAARNAGLERARGEYIFFMDADDTLDANSLSRLYEVALESGSDLVLSDRSFMEKGVNIRAGKYVYPEDTRLEHEGICQVLKARYYSPLSFGIFQTTGRLIRRKLLEDHAIRFEEDLRYLEDETFEWDILAHVNHVQYLQAQLYHYHLHPNVNTALSEGLNKGFPITNFKLVKQHIYHSLTQRAFTPQEAQIIADQGYIYLMISALVSYSRSMALGKIQWEAGVINRRKIIEGLLQAPEVQAALKTYQRSKDESPWILRALKWRSRRALEWACNRRAREIIRIRRQKAS